jgi:outer membrane protein OmpU
MSGTFGKVTLGETDGAFDWALGEIDGGGSAIADDHTTHLGAYWFTGLDATYDNQIMRYEYSFGDFGAAFSLEIDDTGVGDEVIGIGAKWAGDMGGTAVSAGIGYQDNGVNSVWGLSGAATLTNGVTLSLGYADLDNTAFHTSNGFTTVPLVDSWWGLGVAYRTGALSVGINYGIFDSNIGDLWGWGLAANYDLGGGAVLMAGYGSSSAPAGSGGQSWNGAGEDTYSIGVGMSF